MTSLAAFGHPALIAALAFSLLAIAACAVAIVRQEWTWLVVGIRSLTAGAILTALAVVALMNALGSHDFSLEYVASYSSESLTGPYLLAALWGGMEGSLLFWTLLLTGFAAIALRRIRLTHPSTVSWAAVVLAGVIAFFLLLVIGPASPFTTLDPAPGDGQGLNPLLQSPGMLIHPPLLYTGFVGFSIPFAFAMGALLTRRLDEGWFTATRRWTLFSWSALSIGIVLGGAWAYTELGWGGYWAWDPVENASFMPWLTATAFLHSVIIQEKRRMLKVWNVTLILLTYALAVFGTFLTRSGLLSSIHTFTEGPIGKWFLPFLAVMLMGGAGVIIARSPYLRSDNRFDSLLSRESAFLFNNMLFMAAAFTVLWGTIYPVVAEMTTGTRLSVGPPFFNSVFVPIGLAIIALTGIGPLISWRRMDRGAFLRVVRVPLLVGALCVVALALIGIRSAGALLALGLCAFTATAVIGEFVRGSRAYRRRDSMTWLSAVTRTVARNRRRYGGYIVHLGVVLIVIGFSGTAFKTERQAVLDPGGTMQVGSYELTYERRIDESTPEKQVGIAQIAVRRGDDSLGTLMPQRNFHIAQQQPQSEVAIRTTPVEDLYVVVTSFDRDGSAVVRAFVNPLTWWIWAGAAIMLAGMLVILSEPTAPQPAHVPSLSTREPVAAAR